MIFPEAFSVKYQRKMLPNSHKFNGTNGAGKTAGTILSDIG